MAEQTIAQWLHASTEKLRASSDSARLDAEVLCAAILQKDRSYLYAWPECALTAAQLAQLDQYVVRREIGEPIAYILGEKEFWSLPFYTNEATLIPRPDTEIVVQTLLEFMDAESMISGQCRVLDLGTGTGAIGIAIAHEKPCCHVTALDVSAQAVALAERNVERLQVTNITLLQSDWFSNVHGRFHYIVSNPPYIDDKDPHLMRGDVRFEPHSALIAKDGGLDDIRKIIMRARNYLEPGGYIFIEHGWQQARAVQKILSDAGYSAVATRQDYGHNDRVSYGRWP